MAWLASDGVVPRTEYAFYIFRGQMSLNLVSLEIPILGVLGVGDIPFAPNNLPSLFVLYLSGRRGK